MLRNWNNRNEPDPFFLSSSTLIDDFDKALIMHWLDNKFTKSRLVYKATLEEFFDRRCYHFKTAGEINTLVIIKGSNERIYGGFASQKLFTVMQFGK